MTEREAVEHLRTMMFVAQKARSAIAEEHGDLAEMLIELGDRWLSEAKGVLRALDRVLTRVDRGGQLMPGEFFNMMTIAKSSPNISAGTLLYNRPLPAPDPEWFMGWDPE